MKATLLCSFLLAVLATVYTEPQFFGYPTNAGVDYFGSSFQQSSGIEGRFFLGTRTLTIATTTLTKASVSTTTCTTSTAALSNCVASGGRRRRYAKTGSLFHDASEALDNSESIFLPGAEKR